MCSFFAFLCVWRVGAEIDTLAETLKVGLLVANECLANVTKVQFDIDQERG